jgi:SatD family (SatD)
MTDGKPVATLIGDLVGSKRSADRPELQRSLSKALRAVNLLLAPSQPLEPTVGDEFQGVFATVGSAVQASLLLRLKLLEYGGRDSRYGLGYGGVTVFDTARSPTSQDGPGWWSARAAIERAKALEASPRTSFARTCFNSSSDETSSPPTEASPVEAFLFCRDAIVDQMSPRSRRLLLGLLLGQAQSELAANEGITQSAVSQSLARSGAFAIEAAEVRFAEGLA